ncbi:hypothetical protein PG1C_14060 [Rugosibacter aromaticivorans]|uniref:Transmembrane protein n=1 Tax=Rugosibacter aromaticivorans TaxID=1565605 RepID=A0A0C5JBX1_9PROT|nr:BPSS1780 family membrane protein [Rugosibacter aromaticivorans]AJP49254.1 hypothetical protein PG1C_14060 [Rugosibacter aromaticivorans]TBR15234.1 MAG: hypothetical protein EPO43_04775 [Rugosibacter sp.]
MNVRTLPARHGLLWLVAGWRLLRRYPRQMTGITLVYFFVVLVVNLIPFVGPFLLPLVLPTLTALLGNACRALDHDQPLTQDILISGLEAQRINLLRLGGLHLLGSVILLLASQPLMIELNPDQSKAAEQLSDVISHLGLFLLLASPVVMAFWFAPLLTAWNGMTALKALFFSFVASWRNWRAFTVYGLVILGVGVVLPGAVIVIAGLLLPSMAGVLAMLARLALVLLLGPILVSSIYISYRDVFSESVVADE